MVEVESGKHWVSANLRELAQHKAVVRFWWSRDESEWKLTLEGRLAASRELGGATEPFTAATLGACADAANVAARNDALRRVAWLLGHFCEKERPHFDHD